MSNLKHAENAKALVDRCHRMLNEVVRTPYAVAKECALISLNAEMVFMTKIALLPRTPETESLMEQRAEEMLSLRKAIEEL